uniref:PNPL.6c n=2 Tax=Nocardiopsis sp. 25L-1-1c TaxID=1009683 RepID=R4HCV2_9ACTN|nr:pNPL.6c [Nocardiopsis sp. 25L-1-1c]
MKEFKRALGFALVLRGEYGGKVGPAFLEFTSEPDIIGYWETLGIDVVAEMLGYATRLVRDARENGQGGEFSTLPATIRDHGTYGPLINAAEVLVSVLQNDGGMVVDAESRRLVESLETLDMVAVFGLMVMSWYPPRKNGSTQC